MRIVEEDMTTSILESRSTKLGTTRVAQEKNSSNIYFYGSLIAIITEKSVKVNNCGHLTASTKSRLNAILSKFTDRQIYQKNGEWYLSTSETINFGVNCSK
jgi:hypothetical protein